MLKKIIVVGSMAIVAVICIVGVAYKNEIKLLYRSLNGFKDENLAHTFQNMYHIQPTHEIQKGEGISRFETDLAPLPKDFTFKDEDFSIETFLKETQTSGLLVLQDDAIKHEAYTLGSDEETLFASNSMGKSFVSALMGIAISEGYIKSVDEPIERYIPEFRGTDIGEVPIKACLQMASGINFDEEKDMSHYSMRTLLGKPAMEIIAKVGMKEAPYTYRRYLSINTEILGEIIRNATGYSLSEYMEEKLWKKLGTERNAFWTLSNQKELAMGGLSISLRDYARFAKLYLNHGQWEGEQIIPEDWVQASTDISAPYAQPGANNDTYNAIGYGYQWWVPEGDEGEFLAIGVYSQWIYVNRARQIVIVKTSADPGFMAKDYELKHVELFRSIANHYKPLI
ncbi:MAG: serine hydrolase domain-containing protein [Cellulosilyticaceae bacterium]